MPPLEAYARPGAGFPAPAEAYFRLGPQPHTRLMEAASIPAGPPASQRIGQLIGTYGLTAVAAHAASFSRSMTWRSRQPRTPGREPGRRSLQRRHLGAGGDRYTLVYGIVELINFAHGEIFMIALHRRLVHRNDRPDSGLVRAARVLRTARGARHRHGRLRHAQRADRTRRLQTATQRAEAGAADHRGRHVLHPAERRPSLEGRQPAGRPGPPGRAAHALRPSSASRSRTPTSCRSWSRSRC